MPTPAHLAALRIQQLCLHSASSSTTFLRVPTGTSSWGKCELILTLCGILIYSIRAYNFKKSAHIQGILKQVITMAFIHPNCKFCRAKNRSCAWTLQCISFVCSHRRDILTSWFDVISQIWLSQTLYFVLRQISQFYAFLIWFLLLLFLK